ncbi:MAG: DUF4169 family protein [Pikeienuella sp.]
MTGKVINLRQARKSKAREDKRAAADSNAARHGQTKAERDALKNEKSRAQRLLDGHEVENDSGE